MNYCLKSCFHHFLGPLLPGEVGPAHPWEGPQATKNKETTLTSSHVATRHKHSARVYVRRVPAGRRPTYAARAHGYAHAAAAFLLDDDLIWLYTFLLGW